MSEFSYISKFNRIRPKFEVSQEFLLEWLVRAHLQAKICAQGRNDLAWDISTDEYAKVKRFVDRFACSPEKISNRGIHTDNPKERNFLNLLIYKISQGSLSGATMLERTMYFSKKCKQIFEEFYPAEHQAPEHLIHITCTGYVSPSGAQHLVALKNWSSLTRITHAYHMGCYASLPAIRMAQAFAAQSKSEVDLVHTEICSLHLDPNNHSPEQIVVQSLFADGFIKYSVSTETPYSGFRILKVKEFIIPDSAELMTWFTSNFGMQMSLSKEVPSVIANHIVAFLKDFEVQFENCLFAIHPGGPRIIESLQDLLKLRDDQVRHAKSVLFRFGNMSSATLPHIWQDLLDDQTISAKTKIVSLAFGPGLTIFGGLFEKL